MTERRRDVLALALLVLAALVLGHDLTYLVTYGPDYQTALLRTGHGDTWTIAVITISALSALLALLAGWRLSTLAGQARRRWAGTGPTANGRLADLVREYIGLWGLILVSAALLFVLNENVERAVHNLPTTGLAVLAGSTGDLVPLLVLTAVSGVVAAVAALYRWRRDVLVARLHNPGATWARATSTPLPRPWPSLSRPITLVSRRIAGRAPPSGLLSSPC